MQMKPIHKALHAAAALLLALNVLAGPVMATPGCSGGCCAHAGPGSDAVIRITASFSHGCCCSTAADGAACHLTETLPNAMGMFLPAPNGSDTSGQLVLRILTGDAIAVDLLFRNPQTASPPDLSLSALRLYVQLKSLLC